MSSRWFLTSVAVMVSLSCGHPPAQVLLEPDEMVIGRTHDSERVRLLTTGRRILTVNLSDLSTVSQAVSGLASDELWGLGASSDGRLWTLVGTSHLARVDLDGQVGTRRALGSNVVGLFSLDGTILLQTATFAPGGPALRRLDLDSLAIRGVGSLRTASFDTRAEMLTHNLVGCGSGRGAELPCWFSQGLRVDRVSSGGGGRQQVLSGIGLRPRLRNGVEQIDTPGPIVDAHIDALGTLWVLVRRPTGAEGEEYVVARYSSDDRLLGVFVVPHQPRLILDVRDSDLVLLTGTGQLTTAATR